MQVSSHMARGTVKEYYWCFGLFLIVCASLIRNKIQCSCNTLVDALQKPQMWGCLNALLLHRKKKNNPLLPWQLESCTLQETK